MLFRSLPSDVSKLFGAKGQNVRNWPGREEDRFRAVRFRPPALEQVADGVPALPHIRLDRAMQFLIGDRLR